MAGQIEHNSARVLLIGLYCCDLVFDRIDHLPEPGEDVRAAALEIVPGAAFRTAVALRRLGIDVVWPADVGDDPFSDIIRREATRHGIEASLRVHEGPVRRVSVVLNGDADRSFLSFNDPGPEADEAALVEEVRPAWIILNRLYWGEALERIARAARLTGARIFMDCQWTTATLNDPAIARALALVDVFAPNRDELCRLAQEPNFDRAIETVASKTPWLVVKAGADGAFACHGGSRIHVAAEPITVRHSIGAGDCFAAGFVAAALLGLGPIARLEVATWVAGRSLAGYDLSSLPSRDELDARWPEVSGQVSVDG